MVINFQIAPPAQLVGRQTLRSQSWPNIRILRALRSQQQAAVINTIRFFSNFQGFQHQNYDGEIEVFLRAFAQGLAGPRPSLTLAQSPIQEGFTRISNIHIFYDIQGFHGPHGQLERAARALGEGLSVHPAAPALRGYPLHGGTVVVSGSSSITLFGGTQALQNHEGQLDRALHAFAEGLMGRHPAPNLSCNVGSIRKGMIH
jgi:hypothetical protein